MKKPPCDPHCPYRTPTCHGTCKNYIEWAQKEVATKPQMSVADKYTVESIKRRRRK